MSLLGSHHTNPAGVVTTSNPILRPIFERAKERFSSEEFAHLTGYSRGALYEWRTGKSTPNLQTTINLAEAVGLELVLKEKTHE